MSWFSSWFFTITDFRMKVILFFSSPLLFLLLLLLLFFLFCCVIIITCSLPYKKCIAAISSSPSCGFISLTFFTVALLTCRETKSIFLPCISRQMLCCIFMIKICWVCSNCTYLYYVVLKISPGQLFLFCFVFFRSILNICRVQEKCLLN